jgi:1-aminocyclopropane-1-carboxylate deaminase/D-cysteine desulfhydrase-like pyridoxal-dependent ACC family enzyme
MRPDALAASPNALVASPYVLAAATFVCLMKIGVYPTPVDRLPDALGPGRDLWVKRDDLTSRLYGGNKVRKLERILDVAVARGVERIVTVGAAGSHHVLATSIYAGQLGIGVDAVLVPQPWTPHAAENLRAIAARARVFPASSFPHAAAIMVDRVACGAYYVPAGGSSRVGALAYADAARELLLQVEHGDLPEPRVVVVTLGSGGTAAGLAAGLAATHAKTRVLGVTVAEPAFWVAQNARRLAKACLAELAPGDQTVRLRLDIEDRYLGAGYGHATPEGEGATLRAARFGLALDGTYTAKTFAAACALPAENDPILYWHTLSSAPMGPLLEGAPREEELAAEVRMLLPT